MFHIGKREKIPEDELSSEESLFIKALTLYHSGKIEPVMINSRGLFPSIAVEDQNSKERSLILIRRKHPVVKKAILALQIDPQNIELISPVFIK